MSGITQSFFRVTAFLVLICPVNIFASTTDSTLIRTFGGVNNEEFRDLTLLSDHGLMIVGTTNGYGAGSNSIYLVRTDSMGNHIWSRTIGGGAVDIGNAITSFTDTTFLVAGTSASGSGGGYDGYLALMDTAGSLLWERYYGGTDWDFINDVAVLPDHSILLAGESYSYSNGGSDAWALMLNSAGDTIFTKHYGGSGNDNFKSVGVIGSGIYFTGTTDSTDATGTNGLLVKFDFSGNEIWQKTTDTGENEFLNGSCGLLNGNLIIYGGTRAIGGDHSNLFCQELDTSGALIFALASSHSENEYINGAAVTHTGTIVLTGQKDPGGFGQKSMFNVHIDDQMVYINSNEVGGGGDEEGFAAVRTTDNRMAFAGYTTSYGYGNSDGMLVFAPHDTVIESTNSPYGVTPFFETLSPIFVNEITSDDISVYPNPTVGVLNIQFKNSYGNVNYEIFDYTGKKIKEGFINGPQAQIHFEGFHDSFYVLRLITPEKEISFPIINSRE